MRNRQPPLQLLTHPYDTLHEITGGPEELRSLGRDPGAALIWSAAVRRDAPCVDMVSDRPGGLALVVLLPDAPGISADAPFLHSLHRSRPQAILPFHPDPTPSDMAQVLRKPPSDLGAEVWDYLRWRGLGIGRDSAHLIRRIIDLAAELRSVSAVSRGLYMSRRALGRRLQSQGLPVPSHWIQLGRLLRVALRLQNTSAPVASVAFELGYPDGFSLSNQMERLVGHRPSEVRTRLGWEWVIESWLRREAEQGGLSPGGTGHGAAVERRAPPSVRGVGRRRAVLLGGANADPSG